MTKKKLNPTDLQNQELYMTMLMNQPKRLNI